MEHIYSVEIELSKTEYEGFKDLLRIINTNLYKGNEKTLPWMLHRMIEIALDTVVGMTKEETEASDNPDLEEDRL